MEGFIGEVKMFGGNYPPKDWAFCHGQKLLISENQTLFSILGTQFGGDGRTNFCLPNLKGKAAVGPNTGYSQRYIYKQGDYGGYKTVSLQENNIPQHTHSVKCDITTPPFGASSSPENRIPSKGTQTNLYGSNISEDKYMNEHTLTSTGNAEPFNNMQPFIALNYIICLEGDYPPRN
ncbi:MAG: phage tail protein [Rhodothermaceae bacterium]